MLTPEQEKGQGGSCATVKVKSDNEHGYAVINEHDFDPAVHERFDAVAEKSEPDEVVGEKKQKRSK